MKFNDIVDNSIQSVFETTNKVTTGGWKLWLKMLLSHIISGGATAVLSALGVIGAEYVGIDVPTLNFKTLLVIFVSGGITGMLTYLKSSPLPGIDETNSK